MIPLLSFPGSLEPIYKYPPHHPQLLCSAFYSMFTRNASSLLRTTLRQQPTTTLLRPTVASPLRTFSTTNVNMGKVSKRQSSWRSSVQHEVTDFSLSLSSPSPSLILFSFFSFLSFLSLSLSSFSFLSSSILFPLFYFLFL